MRERRIDLPVTHHLREMDLDDIAMFAARHGFTVTPDRPPLAIYWRELGWDS